MEVLKRLLTGNEAVARGAFESGVHFAAAYPGTPSSEILENITMYKEIISEWAPNEKVALESAIGASIAGGRSLAAMKHVGLNVAADPLFTFAYTGVTGGSVIITADEPGQHSAQNEQDNRNYAKAAKLPMFEPADSQDCLDMLKEAYRVSEEYDCPVLFRMTTRVCHSKSLVACGERKGREIVPYERKAEKYVCVPANARKLRVKLEEKLAALKEYSEKCSFNIAEYNNTEIERIEEIEYDRSGVVDRPPTLCAGCPHRGFFYELGRRKNVMVSGDIGCYTLGFAKPFNAIDSCVCMGAGFSIGHGAQKVFNKAGSEMKVVSVLGDSTFFHTGINSLITVAYNRSNTVSVILDNRTTAMTGHQENPGSGKNARGEDINAIDLYQLVKAIGIENVKVVNPNDLEEVSDVLDEFIALDEPSVIITRWPCALKKFSQADKSEFTEAFQDKYYVSPEKCIGCRLCMKCGCPALSFDRESKKASIDQIQCLGCDVCAQVCPKNAIERRSVK